MSAQDSHKRFSPVYRAWVIAPGFSPAPGPRGTIHTPCWPKFTNAPANQLDGNTHLENFKVPSMTQREQLRHKGNKRLLCCKYMGCREIHRRPLTNCIAAHVGAHHKVAPFPPKVPVLSRRKGRGMGG
jgi:hypothetical protein